LRAAVRAERAARDDGCVECLEKWGIAFMMAAMVGGDYIDYDYLFQRWLAARARAYPYL